MTDERWRYRHRILFPGSWLYVTGITVAITGYPLLEPGVEARMWRFAVIMTLIMATVTYFSVTRRAFRSVAVDDEGLWFGGELVVPAREVVAVQRVSVGKTLAASSRRVLPRAWSYDTLLGIEGVGPVVVPLRHDMTNTGGAWTPAVLVVTSERFHGLAIGWLVTSWRPQRLADAMMSMAPRVDELQPMAKMWSLPDSERRAQEMGAAIRAERKRTRKGAGSGARKSRR